MKQLTATVAVVAAGTISLVALAAPPADGRPAEIHQGGYVEKVEPGVDYAHRLPKTAPKEPDEALKTFHLIPGLRIEVAAAEPLVRDPVDLCFDENGRLYVAEMIPYAEGNRSAPGSPRGRISLLTDSDGDGRFDRSMVFADKLVWPTGIACFDGGLFVAAAPNLLYCKDTDGDGRADLREVVLSGFATSNPNALPNSLRFGLDCRLHGMTSTAGGQLQAVRCNVAETEHPVKPIQARGRDFSLHPRTAELRLESGGAQFGMAIDAWGRKFESSNSEPIMMIMADDGYLGRNPCLAAPSPRVRIWTHGMAVFRTSPPEPWRVVRTEMRVRGVFSGPVEGGGTASGYFTAACGLTIYTGDTWPERFRDNAFVCEGAGNLVHRMRLEPAGIGFQAHRTEQGREFLTSDDAWFKPVQMTNGPDGNLYIADMYREVFEHPDAVPPSVKKYLDLTRGDDRGRIYRIVAENCPQRSLAAGLGDLGTAELVALLAHANGWHRHTAARLLYERRDRAAIEPLEQLAAESPNPLARMHALYALAGIDALEPDTVLARLDDAHAGVREHAVRLSERVLANAPAVRERLYRMTDDENARVRYQLAFTLGAIPTPAATAALARIAARDTGESWVRVAVLSSCHGRAGVLLSTICDDTDWRAGKTAPLLLEPLAEQVGLAGRRDQVAAVLRAVDQFPAAERAHSEAVIRGLSRGLKRSGSPLLAELADGSRAAEVLDDLVRRAAKTAVDDEAPLAARVEASGSLSLAPFDTARRVLPDLLDSRQPAELQMAALAALGRFRESGVAELIVDAWGGFSPHVRDAAAEALFARRERLDVLLEAIDDGMIAPSQIDPARLALLMKHPDSAIRDEAKRLLDGLQLARREDAVAAYHTVVDTRGDPQAGREVFKRECAKCHRLEDFGYDLGLPLATVKSRGREGILVQILDPNREVNPAYLNYALLTEDGLTVTGMIAAETATSITLRRSEEESDTVLRTEIDEMQSTGLSIMPEGLEKQISKQQMADLLEYLMSVE